MNFAKTFLAGLLAVVVGSFAVMFLWIFLLAGIAGSMESTTAVPDKAILKIDFSEVITDSPATDPFAGIDLQTLESTPQLTLYKALCAIDAAAADDRIQGIYLRLNGLGGVTGSAQMEELRAALAAFKESGKFIVSYNEYYSQGLYYLASVADKIYLQPQGSMEWSGLQSQLLFYKGLLDKLDLKVEVFRPTVCKYKSAVEPYILEKMSPANREQMQTLIGSMWNTLAADIAESRGIALDELNRMADRLEVALAEEALEKGFVDSLLYEDEIEARFAELGAEPAADGGYAYVSLGDYAKQLLPDLSKLTADQVAIVYADGEIVDGEGTGKIFGNTLAATIASVRKDEAVKAVVLRVNSPGGSALASDLIWREIQLLKTEKPLIVSMGSYAASGGYYISCPADAILADRLTLTGSIGVFGMMIDYGKALKQKLGVTVDTVSSNASSAMGPLTGLTPAQRAMLMRGVDEVYGTFTGYVSEGRNIPLDRVLEIAGGRVWSGVDALEIGLIDGFGGLKEAIALAVEKAGLGENYYVKEVIEEPTGFAAILSSFNASVREMVTRSELEELMDDYKEIREVLARRGVQMYSPYKVELR